MRALYAVLVGALGAVAVAAPGCTAVYSDFEECSLEAPRVFETPPCGPDYNDCLRACGADEMCADRCASDRPDCDRCFTDTYRICLDSFGNGCAGAWDDLICCVEGTCSVTEGLCEDCRPFNEALDECITAADPMCRPTLAGCLQVPLSP